jgi:tRNA pseudouridine38-40 synthase
MPRFKLLLEYDGSNFKGWQIQKGEDTIQGKFFDACRKVFEVNDFEFYGAGRTDAGVHALGQVAHLDVKTSLKPEIIRIRLNDNLPSQLNVLDVKKADNHFHARHDATARSYVYHISKRRTAFGKKYVWWVKDDLNVSKMIECSLLFKGLKDFASFGQKGADQESTKVKIDFVNIHETEDMIYVHIVGSHFLWKMVRRLVGVMVEAGKGKLAVSEVESYFKKYSERPAQLTAPASGLFLEKIYYEGDRIDTKFNKLI